MKKALLLLSILFLSGCAVNYDVPAQSVDLHKDTPAIVETVETKPIIVETPEVQPVVETVNTPVVNDTSAEVKESPSETDSLSNDNSYVNVDGNEVHSPAYSNSVPAGATAICRDGTYSFSQHRSGTCSRHGGVAEWL
jgi:hypothetical protein